MLRVETKIRAYQQSHYKRWLGWIMIVLAVVGAAFRLISLLPH